VDSVVKGTTDFSMVMGSKRGRLVDDSDSLNSERLDPEEDTVQSKKKRIKNVSQ